MRVKNVTPFYHGPKVTSRNPPQHEMMFAVKGTFSLTPDKPCEPVGDLEQRYLTGDVFHEDDVDRQGAVLWGTDLGDYKPRADIILFGTCHAPGGSAIAAPVKLQVGSWSKELQVVGPRVWRAGILGKNASDPVAFESMPLTWDNAFGGPGFNLNTAGMGIDTLELPTVQYANDPVKSPRGKHYPAGFGPLSPNWAQRASKVGKKYGKKYQEERAPWFAEDFDFEFFNSAPEDQRVPFLRGNEEVEFTNLSKDRPTWTAKLPGMRVRAFVLDSSDDFREIELNIDTLVLDTTDPDKSRLTLVWRGLTDIGSDDMSDVPWALVVAESMADEKPPAEHYRPMIEEFAKDPVGLGPEMLAASEAYETEGPKAAQEAYLKAAGGEIDGVPLPKAPDVPPPPDVAPATSVDDALAKLAAQEAHTQTSGAVASTQSTLDALASSFADRGDRPPIMDALNEAIGKQAANPTQFTLTQQMEQLGGVKKAFEAKGYDVGWMDEVINDPRNAIAEPGYTPPPPAEVDNLKHLPEGDPEIQAKLDEAKPEVPPADEPPPPADPEAKDKLAGVMGDDHSGEVYDNQDLKGRDFSNQILTGASFVNANCEGANFTKATLADANFTGANLRNATFDDAEMGSATFTKAKLTGASLKKAFATWANFDDAILAGADCSEATLTYAPMKNVDFKGARLFKADIEKCKPENGDFSGADLTDVRMAEAKAAGAKFTGATLVKSRFSGAVLTGAKFGGADGTGSMWHDAQLDNADFAFANLDGAFFFQARGQKINFYGCNLANSRSRKASLVGANFGACNLYTAEFAHADLSGASFDGANLYGADLTGATLEGTTFVGASLKASTLQPT